MTNVPPKRDPNRPKSKERRGAAAQPDSPPQQRTQSTDGARRDGALQRQDERKGGLGVRAQGGYADQEPKTPAKRR